MQKVILILLAFLIFFSCKRKEMPVVVKPTPFLNFDTTAADSLLKGMTLEEKIGQLILVKTNIKNINIQDSVFQWIRRGMIGGVLLKDLDVTKYLQIVDSMNMLSRIPLLNGTEQMVMLNNQFTDAVHFPLPPSMGAIPNDTLQIELEKLFLEQCKVLGINFCLSPSVNQVSLLEQNYSSKIFENDPERQLNRAARILENLQEEKILSFGNSFVEFVKMENDTSGFLDSLVSRQVFLAERGVSGFLLDEQIFETDSIQKYEPLFLKNYFKKIIDFDGLLIAEITETSTKEKLLHAGTDLFVVQDSAKILFDYIYRLVKEGIYPEKLLDQKVAKILLAKTYAGLENQPPRLNRELAEKIVKEAHDKFFTRQLFEHSITLAQNYNNLIPYTKTYRRDFRIINIGGSDLETFKTYFSKYANYSNYNHPPDSQGIIQPLKTVFHKHSSTVVVLDSLDLDVKRDLEFLKSINDLSTSAKVAVVNFGNPLNLQYFDSTLTLVQVFEKNKITESLVPQLLFGGITAKGSLPLAISEGLPFGKSIETEITRLKYTVPEEVGIAPEKLAGIHAIIQSAIRKKATPGAQVLVVKNGKVIFSEAFGYHTYKKKRQVLESDLYDLASVTKVAATSLAAMKLFENKKFRLRDRIKDHFDLVEKSKIDRITFKQLLTHSSGLQANIPISKFYLNKDTLVEDCNQFFCKQPDENYSIKVADNMYLDERWHDSLWLKVQKIKTKRRGRYKYSDLNFYLMQQFIEKKTNQDLDSYLDKEFYNSLNLRRMAFRPTEKFKTKNLVPTENDDRWRTQLLRGYVHDEATAVLGGVGGSSGLFSNANDMAVLLQMLLNGGTYGDLKYLNAKTIDQFTVANYGNHRGLGFVVKGRRGANSLSSKASKKTYGHTGFSGTCIWVDPENELIYIFLSNRIHPRKSNTKLFRQKVRKRIHDVIYESLDTYELDKESGKGILLNL